MNARGIWSHSVSNNGHASSSSLPLSLVHSTDYGCSSSSPLLFSLSLSLSLSSLWANNNFYGVKFSIFSFPMTMGRGGEERPSAPPANLFPVSSPRRAKTVGATNLPPSLSASLASTQQCAIHHTPLRRNIQFFRGNSQNYNNMMPGILHRA